jgi:hypothetical protein
MNLISFFRYVSGMVVHPRIAELMINNDVLPEREGYQRYFLTFENTLTQELVGYWMYDEVGKPEGPLNINEFYNWNEITEEWEIVQQWEWGLTILFEDILEQIKYLGTIENYTQDKVVLMEELDRFGIGEEPIRLGDF